MEQPAINVLLIEDNPGDARLIREILKDNSVYFLVTVAQTLNDGLTALQANSFDVMLLDLSLPDSHGLGSINKLQDKFPEVPIVVLTGIDDNEMGIEAVKAGAQDYLPKDSLDTKYLIRAIRYSIERHRLDRVSSPREKSYIFLSYSRKDTAIMQRLRDDLRETELKVWVDEEGLEPGTPAWEQAISKAMREAECVVVVLSPDAEQSTWVGRELAMAETLEKRIFPILARGTEKDAIPFRLMSHQWVDARHNYGEAFEKLSGAVKKYLGVT